MAFEKTDKPLYEADEIRKMLLTLIKTFVIHWIDPSVDGAYKKVEDALTDLSDAAYIIADDQVQQELIEEDENGESTGQLINMSEVEALKHG